jgi:hypothetical protein
MKHLLGFIYSLMLIHQVQAQTIMKGKLVDSLNHTSMAYGAVSLIKQSDSTLCKFTFTAPDGSFSLNNISEGKYTLLISRSGFIDYEDPLILNGQDTTIDFGYINLIGRANLLNEVVVKEKQNAIRIRGDTTEYLVDSFLTNKNASVEDLMKKLPGIKVDRNGNITAQGQEVKKVLVDGEEFFGNDPTRATRNIRAEDVEKIQVFDGQTEQAAFTGIDDAQKEKTINLQLKEDARKGYFGKIGLSAGTDERYEEEGMVNAFKNNRKLSAYLLINNTNRQELDWDESEKYGGGNGYEYDEEGGYFYSFSSFDQDFEQIGVPRTINSGIHYSDKLKGEKHKYGITITKMNQQTSGFDNNYTKYILPDTLYFNNQIRDVESIRDKNGISLNYALKIDSMNTIKFRFNANQSVKKSESRLLSENLNGNNARVNNNMRFNSNESNSFDLNTNLIWQHKFAKKGRTFSSEMNFVLVDREDIGIVRSQLNYYDTLGLVSSTSFLDQEQSVIDKNTSVTLKAGYTEPILKNTFLVFDYEFRNIKDRTGRNVNANNGEDYNVFVDSLSNNFDYEVYLNKGGISLKYVTKKLTFNLGGKVSYTDMVQVNLDNQQIYNQYFYNFFPVSTLNYKIKNTTNLSFNYYGYTDQPGIDQLQPLQDYTNPLLIKEGNPLLTQSFTNQFRITYNSYKPISGRSFYANIGFSQHNDDFSSSEQIDVNGVRTIKTINTNGNYSLWSWIYYSFSLKKLNTDISFNTSPRLSRNINYLNGFENTNNYGTVNFGTSINYYLDEKLELGVDADWGYNSNTSSLRKDITTNYWLNTYEFDLRYLFSERIGFNSSCIFNIRQQTEEFSRNLNTTILNASLSYKFLKSKKLILSIEGFDLLNENLGFERQNSSNFVNEHVYSVLQRYVLFRLVWQFPNTSINDED